MAIAWDDRKSGILWDLAIVVAIAREVAPLLTLLVGFRHSSGLDGGVQRAVRRLANKHK